MFDTHVKGSFLAIQAVIGGMKSIGSGRIVNTISGRAHSGASSGSPHGAGLPPVIRDCSAPAHERVPILRATAAMAEGQASAGAAA